jgi:hypothetical protein
MDNSRSIKEAIIDLYLAIKIRSTEELDRINDGNLQNEKSKLMNSADCFQILEYIRSSIEIIMNLKIEDLEKNDKSKQQKQRPNKVNTDCLPSAEDRSRMGNTETDIEGISIESRNLIQQSMKDALAHMISHNETGEYVGGKKIGPPAVYEKLIQKLEGDVRGHIRLEHEMKIHMDYLEGKIEKFEKESS